MKFTATVLPVLTLLLAPIFASPVPNPVAEPEPGNLDLPTRTLQARATTTVSVVTPSDVVVIFEQYPDWSRPSWNYGAVSREGGKNARSTLFTFYFADASPSWAGYTCKLRFFNPVVASGSRKMQLYTLGSPNTYGASWGHRGDAYRNSHIGTLEAKGPGAGDATWEFGGTIPCPTTPYARLGFELAPVGDDDLVEWTIPENGIRVEVLQIN